MEEGYQHSKKVCDGVKHFCSEKSLKKCQCSKHPASSFSVLVSTDVLYLYLLVKMKNTRNV